jgi:hypothetical protein
MEYQRDCRHIHSTFKCYGLCMVAEHCRHMIGQPISERYYIQNVNQ